MNPFPYIEKWISEHGSAATLRDHVALLKSQMDASKSLEADLKDKMATLTKERDDFKALAEKLQTQLDDARSEIKRLQHLKSGVQIVGRRLPDRLRGLDQL
jgi:predicted nuclease with TOPRIM domain